MRWTPLTIAVNQERVLVGWSDDICVDQQHLSTFLFVCCGEERCFLNLLPFGPVDQVFEWPQEPARAGLRCTNACPRRVRGRNTSSWAAAQTWGARAGRKTPKAGSNRCLEQLEEVR